MENPSIALYRDFVSMAGFPEYVGCEILATPSKYKFTPCSLAFQKDSPYLSLFNYYLNEMHEKGTSRQILSKYEPGSQICPDSSGLPLGFDSCFTAFLTLLGGASVGLVLFIIEVISRAMCGDNISFLEMYDKRNKSDIPNPKDLVYCDNCTRKIMENPYYKLKSVNPYFKLAK